MCFLKESLREDREEQWLYRGSCDNDNQMGYSNIQYEVGEPFGHIIIDRPSRTNAVDHETGQQIVDALGCVDENDDLAVGIISGSEGDFSAGADPKEIADGVDMRERSYSLMGFSHADIRKPTIAAIVSLAAWKSRCFVTCESRRLTQPLGRSAGSECHSLTAQHSVSPG